MDPVRAAGLAIVLALCPATAGGVEVVVSRAAFAGGVVAGEPSPRFESGSSVATGPLWFWSEISADASTIDWLRQHKRLPLKHAWYRSRGGAAGDDLEPDFVRDLEDLDEARIERLAGELRLRRPPVFTYRTASCRIDLPAGAWVVKVTDRFGDVIADGRGRDARYEIRVRPGATQASSPCPVRR